jgi:endonuclease/exonuclease/phosphatase family metal-dependent hydrolase
VLPESWRDHGGTGIADRLTDRGWSVLETAFVDLDMAGRPQVAEPGSGTWSLVLASRLPIRHVRDIPLPLTRSDPVPRRHAIHAEVDLGSTTIDVVAFHVSSKLWFAAPPIQLRGLAREVRDLGRTRPAVLVGDANWWRSTLWCWLPGWSSVVRGATFPAHKPHSQIDQVLVRGGLRGVTAEVAPNPWRSDHRAIRATVELHA